MMVSPLTEDYKRRFKQWLKGFWKKEKEKGGEKKRPRRTMGKSIGSKEEGERLWFDKG